MVKKGKSTDGITEVMEVQSEVMFLCVKGKTPLLLNRLAEKARHELMYPREEMNAAEKKATLKHNPVEEYRSSAYQTKQGPTRLIMPDGSFRRAIASAAVDIPGAAKAQIGRLVTVIGINVPVFGKPVLHGAIVRNSGPQRTPDTRFRCCLPEWACTIEISYVSSLIKPRVVANLTAAAGTFIGVGDGRPEKGALNYGCFEICSADDLDFKRILKDGARVQDANLATPSFYNEETEELVTWWVAERKRREHAPPIVTSGRKAAGKTAKAKAGELENVADALTRQFSDGNGADDSVLGAAIASKAVTRRDRRGLRG